MHELIIGLVAAMLSVGSPLDQVMRAHDKMQLEYRALLEQDQAALDQVNDWIRDNELFRREGGGMSQDILAARIRARMNEQRKAYDVFLDRYPAHVDGRIAFASFLNEIGEEQEAAAEWDKARLLDPNQPAAWNNLANYYGHRGPVAMAFPYYEKAIELSPEEPVYYQNLATTVYLFRLDAAEYYSFDEQQVFDHALKLYRKALELSGGSFAVANDLAQTYYGIIPFRYQEALSTWKEVLTLASTEEEKQNVYIHLARIEINGGRFDEARAYLEKVTLPQYQDLRDRLVRRLPGETAADEASAVPVTP